MALGLEERLYFEVMLYITFGFVMLHADAVGIACLLTQRSFTLL